MKKNKRKFLKYLLTFAIIPIFSLDFFSKRGLCCSKKILKRKKFSKIWLLNHNDY